MNSDDEGREEQFGAALHAFNVSAMNGVLLLAARLRGAGALDEEHVRVFHEQISLPLVQPEIADNPFVAPMQDYIDQRFADLLQYDHLKSKYGRGDSDEDVAP